MDGHRGMLFRTQSLRQADARVVQGDGFIGLCSKIYYCFGATDKYSTKGLSKRHNDIDKDTFLTVLTNRRRMGNIKEFQDREHTFSEESREEMDMEKP